MTFVTLALQITFALAKGTHCVRCFMFAQLSLTQIPITKLNYLTGH